MNPTTLTPEMVQALVAQHVEEPIDAHLRAKGVRRLERTFSVGAWNAGQCPRKLWLGLNGAEEEPVEPRGLRNFAMGNMVEDAAINLMIEAGVPLIRSDEARDTFEVPGIGRVRPDVFLDVGGLHLVADIKSISNFGFERAQRGNVDFAYEAQLEVYLRGLDVEWGVLIFWRKDTSHMHYHVVRRNDERWATIQEGVALARGTTMPERPYEMEHRCPGVKEGKCINGKTPARGQPHSTCGGTGLVPGGPKLRYPCSYCGFKVACWGPLTMSVSKEGAPEWRPKS